MSKPVADFAKEFVKRIFIVSPVILLVLLLPEYPFSSRVFSVVVGIVGFIPVSIAISWISAYRDVRRDEILEQIASQQPLLYDENGPIHPDEYQEWIARYAEQGPDSSAEEQSGSGEGGVEH